MFKTMIAAAVMMAVVVSAGAAGPLPADFVYLRAIDPTIRQDMRYAGSDNFTGAALPGYDAGECILRAGAAKALKAVQADLAKDGLGLKVFDCYRPARAVAAMADWAASEAASDATTRRYYPTLDKAKLHALGYIARRSAHSTGLAIDLGLVRLDAAPGPTPAGACTGPAAERSAPDEVDMGTGFDCFDEKSHTASRAISAAQQKARATLLAAMKRHGFANYKREWWHFTFGTAKAAAADFPIAPMPAPP